MQGTTNDKPENMTQETSDVRQSWPLRRVGLRVQDIENSIKYYTRLGLSIVRDERDNQQSQSVGMGAVGRELLSLRVLPGGRKRPSRTAGLYHFAILLGDEQELGSFIRNCIEKRIPLAGAADHLVSQALYLTDPEGNGIEVYADRPRENWDWDNEQIRMDTLPLNADRLLEMAGSFDGFSDRTILGHMHLNVGDLERTLTFYKTLGMDLMVPWMGQANFLAWDRYHHHLGTNVWAGRNVRPVEPDVFGIDFFEIRRPGLAEGVHQDPDGIEVRVVE